MKVEKILIFSELIAAIPIPVIATSDLTLQAESAETRAVNIVIPADGPSFGTAPSGIWM